MFVRLTAQNAFMQNHNALERQLPHGLSDLFFDAAALRVRLEALLAETFSHWGYTRIIPPMFEFYENIAAEAGAQLREELYRFFDREGRTLALRADCAAVLFYGRCRRSFRKARLARSLNRAFVADIVESA